MNEYEKARDNWLDAHYRSEPLQQAKLHAGYGWDACKSFSDKQHELHIQVMRNNYTFLLEENEIIKPKLLAAGKEIEELKAENANLRNENESWIKYVDEKNEEKVQGGLKLLAQDKIISAMEEALDGIKWGKHCTACSCGCHGVAGKALTSLKEHKEKYK